MGYSEAGFEAKLVCFTLCVLTRGAVKQDGSPNLEIVSAPRLYPRQRVKQNGPKKAEACFTRTQRLSFRG
jgi:hypothetical protein